MFVSPFQFPFTQPFNPGQVAAATPWYLSGGISAGNCIAAYQPKGAADYVGSKVNLINNSTHTLTKYQYDPTWNVTTGWRFTYASDPGQLVTDFNPPSGNNTYSFLILFSGITNAGSLTGIRGGSTSKLQILPNNTSGVSYWGWNQEADISAAMTSGVVGIAGQYGFRNGTKEGSAIGGSASTTSRPFYIGATNNGGNGEGRLLGYIQAIAYYSVTLTDAQMLAVTTAMNAL
jgi:hypothetical protein